MEQTNVPLYISDAAYFLRYNGKEYIFFSVYTYYIRYMKIYVYKTESLVESSKKGQQNQVKSVVDFQGESQRVDLFCCIAAAVIDVDLVVVASSGECHLIYNNIIIFLSSL